MSEPTPTEPPPERQFPCEQCGANVVFAPGVEALTCPYCGHGTHVPVEGSVVELDYHAQLAELTRSAPESVQEEVSCEGCGVQLERPPELDAFDCPYCGRAIVATASSRRRIRPDSVLPFKVKRSQALESFRKWVGSRWFAPSEFKRRARNEGRLQGVYQPYWTYDCDTRTHYTGQRGDAYWDTVTVTENVKGKSVRRTKQVRKIRWWPASGVVHCSHDDVLVPAAESLPGELQSELEPWDLGALVPYRDEYLAGFLTEGYRVEIEGGFERAKLRMNPVIRRAAERDIGGDEQRVHSMDSSYSGITFKHVLLPLWISSYRFGQKSYRFLVNARTGEVAGERPWSVWKIAGAVALGLVVVALVIVFSRD